MNPLAQAAIGSILRWALALAAGYLVKAGIWTGTDAETYVAAAALALVPLLWSLWAKYKDRLLRVALNRSEPFAHPAEVKALAQTPEVKAQAFSSANHAP